VVARYWFDLPLSMCRCTESLSASWYVPDRVPASFKKTRPAIPMIVDSEIISIEDTLVFIFLIIVFIIVVLAGGVGIRVSGIGDTHGDKGRHQNESETNHRATYLG